MSDVTETLQDLMERRLREMGHRRGRGESISLREAYQKFVDLAEAFNQAELDKDFPGELITVPTYEVFRRIRKGHTNITDATALALATMLDVHVDDVYAAAQIRPRLGRFEMPTRADRLDQRQRAVIMSMVDALLEAGEAATTERDVQRRLQVAARQSATTQSARSAGRRQDEAATRPDPEGPPFGA